MFTRSDLDSLMGAAPPLGVSIFLPTHVRGREIRQDPIRLKNLVAEAREKLGAAGVQSEEADALLAPATALVDDYRFWQHQDQGFVLFLGDGDGMRRHKVPIRLAEQVVVGPGFHVKPLLPILAADGAFLVLTITADGVRLFHASRFTMVEDGEADLPDDLDEVMGEPDYENPLQASPAGRPRTAPLDASKAQVYGDSPEDWRKARTVEFVRRTAAALESHSASRPVPVVLVADAEIAGHFRKLTTLGPLLAGTIEANPEAMNVGDLHASAYAVVRPRFDEDRRGALERFAALRGSGDARALAGAEGIVKAAHHGRVDTLLVAEGSTLRGRFDEAADAVALGDGPDGAAEDLLDAAAVRTLRHGGGVYVLPPEEMPQGTTAAAILRY